MGILANSKQSEVKQAPIILIYGAGGLGKDTFASQAPKPFALDFEDGMGKLPLSHRHVPSSYDNGIEALKEILTDDHDFKTVIVSGLDRMERLLHKKLVEEDGKAKGLNTVAGGFGNGPKLANEVMGEMQTLLQQIRNKRNMMVICVGHEMVYTYNDPTAQSYDRYRLKMYEDNKTSAAKLWFDFADIVLFAKKKVYQSGENRALDEGKHYIYTQGRAAFDAKSRYDLPFEIELKWPEFEKALNGKAETAADVLANIVNLSADIKDVSMKERINAAIEKNKNSLTDLKNIRENVKTILQRA